MFKKVRCLAAGALMALVAGCGNPYLPGTPGYAETVVQSDVPPGTDRPAVEAGDVVTRVDRFDDVADGGDAPLADVVGDEDVTVVDRAEPIDRLIPEDGADGGDVGEDVAMDVAADRATPDVPVVDIGMDVAMDVASDNPDSGTVDAADVVDVPADVSTDAPADRPVDTGPVCTGGTTLCGGVCVNTQTDDANCGRCGNACPFSQVCSAGACSVSCGAGTTNCAGDCVDIGTDPNNCGACFTGCGFGPHSMPVCRSVSLGCWIACESGYLDCDGNAANGCEVAHDVSNCGACRRACAFANAAATCATGTCALGACNTGFGNCDGNASNGCEAALNTTTNCGVCGRACMGTTPICNGTTCVQCMADRDCATGYRCNTSTNSCYVVVPRMRSVYVLGRGITSVYLRVSDLSLGSPGYIVTPDRGGDRGTWRANACIGGFSAMPSMIVCPEIDILALLPPGTIWDAQRFMVEDDAMVGSATLCGTTNDCNGCWASPTWSCSTTTCVAGGEAPRDNVIQDARNPTGGTFTVHQLRPQGIPGARRAPCIPTS